MITRTKNGGCETLYESTPSIRTYDVVHRWGLSCLRVETEQSEGPSLRFALPAQNGVQQ